jgi:D-alanyl-D-alanine carboxypeptidase
VAGRVLAKAAGGHSWHNVGLAVDCAPETIAGSIDWNPQHPQWKRMEAAGAALGFVSGANWMRIKDAPLLTGRLPVSPDEKVPEVFQRGGIAAVWEASGLSSLPG